MASFSFFSARAGVAFAIAATLAGCAAKDGDEIVTGETTEAEVHVAEQVVVADPRAIAIADVASDRVTLPLSAGERYRDLAPGTILVGARGAADGKNPDGFLRRVSGVRVEGDAIVIATTPATLTDAIVDGSVKASSGGSRVDDHLTSSSLKGIEIDFADEPLFDNVDVVEAGGKTASFTESIRLERAVLSARPTVDVDLRIQGGKVTRFVSKIEGNLDTSIRAVASVSSEGDVDEAVLAALREKKHDIDRVLLQSKRLALPTFSVGKIPVSPSVMFTVSLRCSVAFGGAVYANAGVEAKSFVRLGGMYADGAWGPPIQSDFDIRPTFEMTRGAEVKARCALVADAELYVYGVPGVTMSVAPYLDFDVEAGKKPDFGAQPFVWKVQAGATGAMRGRDGVFGLPARDLERELVQWKAPAPLEGTTAP